MLVADQAVVDAVVPLNVTVLLPFVAPNVVPVIVTEVPTGPPNCPDGFVFTATAYPDPVATFVANVNGPLAATDRSSPPLSCSTTVPDDKPDTTDAE